MRKILWAFAIIPFCASMSASASATDTLYKKLSPLIFRVKTALGPDAPKASYGSGFVVDKNGLIITNYHVVAEVVQKKQGYKNYVVIGEKPIQAKIVSLDVVHDLALLKIDHTFQDKISIVDQEPKQGEATFAFGIPLDLNMSIVNGLFNGFRKVGPFDQMQMSTPINSGMSGGPTTNANGVLIGVNVSAMTNANNLTFAVPSRFVKKLIKDGMERPFESEESDHVHSRIQEQLIAAQDELMQESLKKLGKTKIGQWTVPEIPDLFKCWMSKQQEELKVEARKIDQTEQTCIVEQEIYLANNEDTLNFTFRLFELNNLKLNKFQFGSYTESVLNRKEWVIHQRPEVEEEESLVGSYRCDDLQLWNSKLIPFSVTFCTRAYIRYPKLFETFIKFSNLDTEGKNHLIGRVRLDGFTRENSKIFIREFIEHVSRND